MVTPVLFKLCIDGKVTDITTKANSANKGSLESDSKGPLEPDSKGSP